MMKTRCRYATLRLLIGGGFISIALFGCAHSSVSAARFSGFSGDYDAMLTQCRAALIATHQSPEAQLCIADAYSLRGDHAAAHKAYRHYLKTSANDHAVRLKLIQAAIEERALTEARQEAQRVIAAEPQSAKAYYYLGLAELYAGECQAAAKALRYALQLAPDDRLAQFRLQTIETGGCHAKKQRRITKRRSQQPAVSANEKAASRSPRLSLKINKKTVPAVKKSADDMVLMKTSPRPSAPAPIIKKAYTGGKLPL